MALDPGSRLGPYEVLAPLGAGGMGEVYRARDTKLSREVAIKVLPDDVARDPERLSRFRREATLLAALNHPHVAAIHDLEESDGSPFLVLELVEGEDLVERLKRGPIPVDEALEIARQIAEALEEAHEKSIVHRDLKPANVKLTPDGQVKVLDFGLAKAYATDASASGGASDFTQSPTLARSGTAAGVILGTPQYMSPEQARGKPVDKRTDIWAFAVVLFEMLTGRRLFDSQTVSDVLAAVLTRSPEWSALPSAVPPTVWRLLQRCLERDPRARLRDIGEARIALTHLDDAQASLSDQGPRAALRRRHLAVPVAVLALGIAVGWLGTRTWTVRETAAKPVKRFVMRGPLMGSGASTAISPDGRWRTPGTNPRRPARISQLRAGRRLQRSYTQTPAACSAPSVSLTGVTAASSCSPVRIR